MLSPLGTHPRVTVAIPCLNEILHIEKCISDVLAQDYPADLLEIIVADGGSTDGTRQRLTDLSSQHPRVRWIDNPKRLQSAGLNEIIRQSVGDIIVRLDAHCEYSPNYVSESVEVLRITGAWNVGGSQRARPQTPFQQSLCAALLSKLGVGGASYRRPDAEGFVDTVFNGSFRREVFEIAGLYDAAAVTNEDAELNQRILESGGKIYLSPRIVSYYFPRSNFRSLARQYFRYGQGRARTLLKRRKFPRISPAVPFFMTASGALLLIFRPLAPSTWAAFGSYGALCGVEAIRMARPIGLDHLATVWAIFPTLHVAHGVGFATGLVRYTLHPDWPARAELLSKRLMPEGT